MSAALGQAFEARGIKVITGARVQALERSGEQVILHFTRGGPVEHATTEVVFAALGWPANLQNLDLDSAAVTSSPGAIPVDDYLQTNVQHIFAAGDVNGRSKLVQSARLEGRIAAWNAVHGPTRQPGHDVVATGSFTDPEYGSVGLTEAQAAHDHDVAVGIARYADLVRPVADGLDDCWRIWYVVLEAAGLTGPQEPQAAADGLSLPDPAGVAAGREGGRADRRGQRGAGRRGQPAGADVPGPGRGVLTVAELPPPDPGGPPTSRRVACRRRRARSSGRCPDRTSGVFGSRND